MSLKRKRKKIFKKRERERKKDQVFSGVSLAILKEQVLY